MTDQVVDGDSSTYQVFLEGKHKGIQTPETIIDAEVEKAIGVPVESKQRLIVGESNEVYKAIGGGQEAIIRISRSESPRFQAEKWVIDQARAKGIPVPTVLSVSQVQNEGETLTLLTERKLPGRSLEELVHANAIDQSTLQRVVEQAGEILANIHTIQPEGFGYINADGKGENASWEEYVLALEGKRDWVNQAAINTGVSSKLIDQAFDVIAKNKEGFKDIAPHLLHCDYSLQHIFVDNGKITGIIDWENAKSGDPITDFAWYDFYNDWQIPTSWLKQGYERVSSLPEDYELRLHLARLHLGLRSLAYYEGDKNADGVNHTKKELGKDFDYFGIK